MRAFCMHFTNKPILPLLYRRFELTYKLTMEPIKYYPNLIKIIETVSFGLEIIAVLIISVSILVALFNLLRHLLKREAAQICINSFKRVVGKGIQVALELLIAADIINTVVLDATLQNVVVLAILVIIRTFLSWTLVFETDGEWPFHRNSDEKKGNCK